MNEAALPRSAVDHYLDVVQAFGCARRIAGRWNWRPRRRKSGPPTWSGISSGGSSNEPVIALNTGGAYGSAKTWPGDRAADLARDLADRYAVLISVRPVRTRVGADDVSAAPITRASAVLVDQPLSIGLTKACLRRCRLMVTTDSGPRHIAAAFGVPTVTLFGPTDPRWSHNYHTSGSTCSLTLPCRPCGQRTCPQKHHRCMRDLTVEHVLAILQRHCSIRTSVPCAA